jgi:hypothetical protein
MSQQNLVPLFHDQRKSATVIHRYLLDTFGPLAISFSIVSRTIRTLSWNPLNEATGYFGDHLDNLALDTHIQASLTENPGRVDPGDCCQNRYSEFNCLACFDEMARICLEKVLDVAAQSHRRTAGTTADAKSSASKDFVKGESSCLTLSFNRG